LCHELFPAQESLISQSSQNVVHHERTAEIETKSLLLK